jgi:predicted Ser/Thr protein kinase
VAGSPPDDTDPAIGLLATDSGEPGGRGKTPRQVRPGDRLGRYDLGDELGEGGMATVFRARDRELRRDVAVKVMFPHLARRPDVVRRFHREARAAAGVEHANILRIYDVGGADGDDPPYIVMELIRGRTLLQEIEQRGAMLAEIAACIGALLGDALAAAHAAGVIHRDVKPANVLIAPGGRLLLADFGVARLETEDSLVTRAGALLGTPAYMSPEQACGDVASARSDLYSLGATLYQLATGALPYAGSPAKVMSLIAAGSLVAPVRRRPACGPDLSRLIERLMATEADARPASASAISAELRALAAAGGLGDASEELAAYFADPEAFLATRTPTVVAAQLVAARDALAAARLPRAMALAERASALAPSDPRVAALVVAVTQGGHVSRRNHRLALGGLVLGLAGGVTALGVGLASSSQAVPPVASAPLDDAARGARSAGRAAADPSAAPPIGDHGARAQLSDAAPTRDPAAAELDGVRRAVRDPGPRRPRDGSPRRPASDASAAGLGGPRPAVGDPDALRPRDAGAGTQAADVGEVGDPPVAHLVVHNDVWCSVWIDGVERGNRRNERLEVTPGRHVVRCVNPAGEWTQEVEVAPGATRTLTGSLLRELTIRIEVDATIDGKPYPRGSRLTRKPGNVEVTAGGRKQFITFRASCTLRDVPELGCYL